MGNNSKLIQKLIGQKVRHNFSRNYIGKITQTREDITGYNYYVEWGTAPEMSDWYSLSVLEKIKES